MAEGSLLNNLVDKHAVDLDYQTPERILAPVRSYFGGPIPLDAATTPANPTKAVRFYALPQDDGLVRSWDAPTWINPPYGKPYRAWLAKILDEAGRGREILALLPANRFEQGYFQNVLKASDAICFVRKRVAFLRPSTGLPAKGNPYGSLLLGFNAHWYSFVSAFRGLGLCVSPAADPSAIDLG